MMVLPGSFVQHRTIELRLRRFDRDLLHGRGGQLRQERIALRPHVDDGGIAETDVDGRGTLDAVERSLQPVQPDLAGLVRTRLHIGLVDLHDVGAGREQILDLRVHRRGVVEHHLLLVLVEIVLRLLRHRKGTGDGDLDRALGIGAQELHVAHLDWMLAAYFAGDARHWIGMAGAVERGAGIVDVDAFQRGGEAVGVALAPLLAVGDDVEAGALLVADCDSVASSCACSRYSGATRHSSRARTRGGKRPASLLRSISQSGCG